MVEIETTRSLMLRPVRAVSTVPVEASDQGLTQRRVIDLKRHASARCCL